MRLAGRRREVAFYSFLKPELLILALQNTVDEICKMIWTRKITKRLNRQSCPNNDFTKINTTHTKENTNIAQNITCQNEIQSKQTIKLSLEETSYFTSIKKKPNVIDSRSHPGFFFRQEGYKKLHKAHQEQKHYGFLLHFYESKKFRVGDLRSHPTWVRPCIDSSNCLAIIDNARSL